MLLHPSIASLFVVVVMVLANAEIYAAAPISNAEPAVSVKGPLERTGATLNYGKARENGHMEPGNFDDDDDDDDDEDVEDDGDAGKDVRGDASTIEIPGNNNIRFRSQNSTSSRPKMSKGYVASTQSLKQKVSHPSSSSTSKPVTTLHQSSAYIHSTAGIASRKVKPRRVLLVEEEEQKVKNATVKLVIWLRDRLHKRLREIASLEQGLETERILLKNLNQSIANQTSARTHEIRLKLATQKKLADFRRQSEEPDRQLRSVQSEAKKLSDQLALVSEKYNALAETHKELEAKLRSAGLSHWLDTRGEEYFPRTAVGVLSKSTELFEPLSNGLGKAVELDNKLAREVEVMVTGSTGQGLLTKVFEDFVMLVPMLPILLFLCKLVQAFRSLSVLHLVLYIAGSFTAESMLLIVATASLGREPLRAMQVSHERLLIAAIFINTIIYAGYLFTQSLIALLRFSKLELAQTLLGAAIGYHYFMAVFTPAVTDQAVSCTIISHVMAVVNFSFVMYEKKRILQVTTRYDDRFHECLLALERWCWETSEAMSNVFRDKSARVHIRASESRERSFRDIPMKNTFRYNPATPLQTPTQKPYYSGVPQEKQKPLYGRWAGARLIATAQTHQARNANVRTHSRRDLRSACGRGNVRSPSLLSSGSETSGAYASCQE